MRNNRLEKMAERRLAANPFGEDLLTTLIKKERDDGWRKGDGKGRTRIMVNAVGRQKGVDFGKVKVAPAG
ncbi:hypothetical protein BC938DRAFT_482873, partial [Jimgerdemannia flammicorona]